MEDIKTKILQSIPIENYISRFVSLKKQGRYLVGLCPFHKEKTPSFTVTPEKGIFYCFGCGRGGNLITFVIEKEQVSFKEALEILANYAGIKISFKDLQTENKYIKTLEIVLQEFQTFLFSTDGKKYYEYLIQRGIEASTITKFQLGASPEDFSWIAKKLFSLSEDLLHLGIIKKNQYNEYYDFFRNRVIFPIFNSNHQVVGFGGRVIDDSKPKYINSPESSIFHKGSLLYGLNFALPEIRKKNEVLITEGYLDVIGMHQIGEQNIVAPLGTAFTEEHKKNILRYAKSIILMMDGDLAGRNSILKTLLLFQEEMESVLVLLLPEGLDPFDLSKKIYHKEIELDFKEIKHQSISGLNFIMMNLIYLEDDLNSIFPELQDITSFYKKIQELIKKENLENYYKNLSIEKKQKIIHKIKDYLLNIRSSILKDLLSSELETITKLKLHTLVENEKNKNFSENSIDFSKSRLDKEKNILYIIERELIGTLIKYPAMIKTFYKDINNINFYDDFSQFIWRILYEKVIVLSSSVDIPSILALIPVEQQNILIPYILKDEYSELNKISSKIKIKDIISDNEIENIIKELITKHRIEEINQLIKNKQNEIKVIPDTERAYIYNEIDKLLKEKKMLASTLRGYS